MPPPEPAAEQEALRTQMATVVFVDVAESVRHLAADQYRAILRFRRLLDNATTLAAAAHQGQLVERVGDGLLLRFTCPRQALSCANALHALADDESGHGTDQQRLWFRIGMHHGQVMVDEARIYGLAVSLASRITAYGRPGDTLLSAEARSQMRDGMDGTFLDLGDCWLKHVDQTVRLYRASPRESSLPSSLESAIAARLALRPVLLVLPAHAAGAGPAPGGAVGWNDVLTDRLSARFSRTQLLHVISAMSAGAWREREVDMAAIYGRWHADYVLQLATTGEPKPHDPPSTPLAVRATLWRKGVGEPILEHAWAGQCADLLDPQSELIGRLHQAVCLRILKLEQAVAGPGAVLPNLALHTLHLNAVDLLHRVSYAEFDRARQLLVELNERAPRSAVPLAWLSRWHVFKVLQGWTHDAQQDGQRALEFSQRACDLDPTSSTALTMAGAAQAGIRRDPEAAQGYYQEALRHNPNDSLAWLMSGVAQGFLERRDDALAASELALGLAPLEPIRHFYDSLAATASLRAGKYERCIALSSRAIAANATHGSSHRALAIAQAMSGQLAAARETVAKLLLIEPHCTIQLYLARVGPVTQQSRDFADALRQAGVPES